MQRTLLIVNAVNWSERYPAEHPLRDVHRWFTRHLEGEPGLGFTCIEAEAVERQSLDGIDAVLLSGSPRNAYDDDAFNHRLIRFAQSCRDRELPFLGVCFGHQILARALGGRVRKSPANYELGTCRVALTDQGRGHALFDGLGETFEVIQSHQDEVETIPDEGELLAEADHTPIQSFQWGPRMLGVQFHPEMDPDVVRFLWGPRRAAKRDQVPFDLDAALDQMRDTPHAPQVLRNFVRHFVPSA